ncbi:MAG TPA: LPS export ABC transporter periplasmic protein LptC [Gemmatimonadota bacterium]|nr:LPS export ABC transporter periplasmic protein LptC [Gemmatimonadota bacterium]
MTRAVGRVRRFGFLSMFAALAAACGGSDEPSGADGEPSVFASGADQVMFGVEQYITQAGIRRGVLRADTAYIYDDASRIEMRRLEIRFFDEAGTDLGRLTGRRGEYLLPAGDMTVHGAVELNGRLQSAAPSVLETDSLAYDAAADELATDAAWTLTHPDGTVEQGTGLVTDPAMENIRRRDWSVTTPDVAVPQ